MLGTPAYMAPEQCRGENVTAAADVYSFGVMIHRALTGKVPFEGKNLLSVAVAQTVRPAPPMSSIAGDLPAHLDEPVLRMLAKDPGDRPATVGEAFAALVEAGGLSIPAPPGIAIEPAAPRSRLRLGGTSWLRAGSLAAAATLVGAVAMGWYSSRHEPPARPRSVSAPADARKVSAPTDARSVAAPDGSSTGFWTPRQRRLAASRTAAP
ncbi:MAG: hypothetical protein EOO75_19920 [Myxococcales bacterium]|nr:MAG: hypothetical protein EOO75_19920 [Myxococcales bacterium]